MLVDDRKKLGMDFADPMIHSEWRGHLRGRLVKHAQPSVEENRLNFLLLFKMDMMMMMMMIWAGQSKNGLQKANDINEKNK